MTDQKNHVTCLMKTLIKLTHTFKFLGKSLMFFDSSKYNNYRNLQKFIP